MLKQLKSLSIANSVNAKLSALRLDAGISKLESKYGLLGASSYSEDDVLQSVADLLQIDANERPKVVWIGGTESQDNSGFLPALNRVADVFIFRRDGEYGLQNPWTSSASKEKALEVKSKNSALVLEYIKEVSESNKLDLLLGQFWGDRLGYEMLQEVQSMGIPTVCISMDDVLPFNWSGYKGQQYGAIGLGPGLDLVLTTYPDSLGWYHANGVKAIFWPLASDPELFITVDESEKHNDVVFIGNKYGIRAELVSYLRGCGINVVAYGNGWENGSIGPEEMGYQMSHSKVILGIGTVGHSRKRTTMKLRDFDATMCGSVYVTSRSKSISMIFEEGVELDCWSSFEECANKIKFYLDNNDCSEKMGRAARKAAIQRHSWDIRISETFAKLGFVS